MNFFKGFVAFALCSMVSTAIAMNQMPQFEHQQPARQQRRSSFISHFIPSSRAVKMGLKSAAWQSCGLLAARFLSGPSTISMGQKPLPFRLFSYTSAAIQSGRYIVDQERGGVRCYASQKPHRYDRLSKRFWPSDGSAQVFPVPGTPAYGWSPVHAGMSVATEVGSDLLFPKFIAMAGSLSILQKAGTLMALGVMKPGLLGIATMCGVNLAMVFGAMATKYAVEQLLVNPVVRPLLICLLCRLRRLLAPLAPIPIE